MIEATYRSKCALCEEWIEVGDEIEADSEGNWAHQDCAEGFDEEDE